jgi:hypothetical protein
MKMAGRKLTTEKKALLDVLGFQTIQEACDAFNIKRDKMARIASGNATLMERLALSAFIAGLDPWSPQIENQLLAQRELISSIRNLLKPDDYDEVAASQRAAFHTPSPTG